MKQSFSLFFVCAFLSFSAFSQTSKGSEVKGHLSDSLQKQEVFNATISLINAKDSILVAFTRSDENGRFSFTNLAPGEYRLAVSHVNFHPLWKNFSLQKDVDLGIIS